MRDNYTNTSTALRDALRHVVERGGASALGGLHQGTPSLVALAGTDGTAQAGRIRRQLERLSGIEQAVLIVAHAPRDVVCNCGSRCCSGRYANPEWQAALSLATVHVAPHLAGHALNSRLRAALVENALTGKRETAIDLAQRCGLHRQTVADHARIIGAVLVGTRQSAGEYDRAFERLDALLREAGIVESAQAA